MNMNKCSVSSEPQNGPGPGFNSGGNIMNSLIELQEKQPMLLFCQAVYAVCLPSLPDVRAGGNKHP